MKKGDRADTEGSRFVETVHVRRLFQGICYLFIFFLFLFSDEFCFCFCFQSVLGLLLFAFYLFVLVGG